MTFQIYKKYILPFALAVYIVSTCISMATMSIGAGFLAFVLFFLFFDPESQKSLHLFVHSQRIRIYFLFSILLFFVCFLSLLIAFLDPVTVNQFTPTVSFLKDLSKTWYLFWPLFICFGLYQLNQKSILFLTHFWIFLLCVFGSLAIYQYFTGWPRVQQIIYFAPARYHASLFIGHHLSVASIFIFPFFFSLDYLFYEKRNWKLTFLYALPCIFGFLLLFLTFSRILWMALPIGLFVWFILRLSFKKIIFILIFLILFAAVAFQNNKVKQNLNHRGGIQERLDLWSANLEFYKMSPYFGVGFRKNGDLSGPYLKEKLKQEHVFAGHAHNNFLEMLASTGIFGASIWLLWCLFPFGVLLWLKTQGHMLSQGLFAAWIVFHINGLTQVNFWDAKALHQVSLSIAWMLFFVMTFKKNSPQSTSVSLDQK